MRGLNKRIKSREKYIASRLASSLGQEMPPPPTSPSPPSPPTTARISSGKWVNEWSHTSRQRSCRVAERVLRQNRQLSPRFILNKCRPALFPRVHLTRYLSMGVEQIRHPLSLINHGITPNVLKVETKSYIQIRFILIVLKDWENVFVSVVHRFNFTLIDSKHEEE